MFLISSLSIVLLFLLSLLMPVMSFSLPVYKIKKMKNFTTKEKLIVNLIAMIIIAVINPILLIIYLGFFMLIEVFYKYFNSKLNFVKKFDRIIIISLVVTLFMSLLLIYLKDDIQKNMEFMMLAYEKTFSMSKAEALEIFDAVKQGVLYYIFGYSILCVFMIYISLDIADYNKWEISFEWLLIYIIGYFAIHIFKIDNFYINNFKEIGEIIFIFYGVKSIYSILSRNAKYKGLINLLAIIIGLLFPFWTFIIGVLGGFGIEKYIKKK